MTRPQPKSFTTALLVFCAASCAGAIAPRGPGDGEGGQGGQTAAAGLIIQRSALQRLSKQELRNTVTDLLFGDPAAAAALENLGLWPEDSKPFDNDYTQQIPSGPLVDAAKAIAEDVAAAVLRSPSLLQKVAGCAA